MNNRILFLCLISLFNLLSAFYVKNDHSNRIAVFYYYPIGRHKVVPYNHPKRFSNKQYYHHLVGDIKNIEYYRIEPDDSKWIELEDNAFGLWFVDFDNGFIDTKKMCCYMSLVPILNYDGSESDNDNKVNLKKANSSITVFSNKDKTALSYKIN